MSQHEDILSRYLLFYQVDNTGDHCTLHLQLAPSSSQALITFELLHTRQYHKSKAHLFRWDQTLISLEMEDKDLLFLYTRGYDGTVNTGGIWQIQWRNDQERGGVNGYIFREITSSGIEMVNVKTLAQEEEYTFFQGVVARAQSFLKEQHAIASPEFIAGRELGDAAPERIHQVTDLPSDPLALDHTWLLVFSGFREYTSKTLFFLLEVTMHPYKQSEPYTLHLLKENGDETNFI